ncbi:phosphatidylinositol mannoside acyltransferase [Kineococcus rubinsiae]|uniref:phosphatidylinositol mannoside acyltransferase n=1 Tax=Kineococcus rubinsiae TaxID=2609562 RepID=UPI0014320BCB|nr:phosphatidylinositol mannoside acyltransferase [Kineococcus rubinsiae]NIZ89800.1 phosphatidylinositol mannoside acyltransferase [Kineococcus rubinsiae]
MSRAHDVAVGLAFRAGWRVLRVLPEAVVLAGSERVAARLHRGDGPRVRQLRETLRRARPDAAPTELEGVVRAGLASYARYWCETFRLPSFSRERIVTTVSTSGLEPVRAALAEGRGVVLALGHLGNWDHAGAWATLELAPVVTVAERLRPEAVYDAFLAFRASLGMTVLPLGEAATSATLVRRLRAGALVPLLADRDLTGHGVPVRFLGEELRMAAGPASLALATGAALFTTAVTSVPLPPGHPARRTGARWGLHLAFGPRLTVPPAVRGAGRPAAVAALTQELADGLAAAVAARPEDWHVLQPVFTADVERARRAAP